MILFIFEMPALIFMQFTAGICGIIKNLIIYYTVWLLIK